MLIINCDDFGLNESVNKAIVDSFAAGLCSSTTIMATMPGFEEACSLARDHRLNDHIGLHIVLRDGVPLSDEIRKCGRFCNQDGQLALQSSPPVFALEVSERSALAKEIRLQIARCRSHGIPLSHADSHYHLHNLWPILGVVIAVAHSEHIPYLRVARNCGAGIDFKKRAYKAMVNQRLRNAGLSRTRYFGGIEDYLYLRGKKDVIGHNESFEIMIHPTLHEKGFVADAGEDESLQNRLRSVDLFDDAISFSGEKYFRMAP